MARIWEWPWSRDRYLFKPGWTHPGRLLARELRESLLDQRFAAPLPSWASFLVDVVFGYLLLVVMGWAEGNFWKLLLVLVSVLLPFFAAYVLLVNLGRYLDFIIPMLFLLFHIPIDWLERMLEHKGSKERHRHAQPASA